MRKKIENKLLKLMEKYPITIPIVRIYYILVSKPMYYIESLFKKDIKLSVSTLTADGKSYPDSIRGVVVNGRSAYSFSSVPYEEIDNLLDMFQKEDKPIDFEIEYVNGCCQSIRLTPKLRKIMIDRLEDLKDEYGTETFKEDVKI